MLLQYSVIARGSTILCSHRAEENVNFDAIMMSVLPNIPTSVDQRTSYTSNNNLTINVMVDNGITYLCASDSSAGKKQPFAFLNEIKRLFTSSSLAHRAQFAGENELSREFEPVLSTQMEKYSAGAGDPMASLQSQVDEVKGVMTQNIERVLERGQRLEELMDKTTDLEASAATFQKTARRVQRHMCWRNTRMTIILVVVSILVVGIIIIVILFSTHVLPPSSGSSGSSGSNTTLAKTATK